MKTYIKQNLIILLLLVVGLTSCSKDDKESEEASTKKSIYISGYESITPNDITKVWKNGEEAIISDQAYYSLTSLRVKLNDLYVFGNDTYVAGSELIDGKNIATYWKNGEAMYLTDLNTSSKAKSIFVTTNDVFVVGEAISGGKKDAVIWRNEIKTVLFEGDALTTPSATSVYVTQNDDVYVVGYSYVFVQNRSQARIWKNGVEIFEDVFEGLEQSSAKSVFVSNGVVYVAGSEFKNGVEIAAVWINGVITRLTDGVNHASANAVYVSGNDIYVAGVENNGSNDEAKIWKNGVATPLTVGTKSYAHSVFVSENDVYVVGYERIDSNNVAMLWENGVAKRITDGTHEAIAYDVFVTAN